MAEAPVARAGSYEKGVAKRAQILTEALDVVSRVGYSKTTVRELADAVGLTPNGLLYYFGTKENLFVEILRRRDELDYELYSTARGAIPPVASVDLGQEMASFVQRNAEVSGLVQLYVGLSAEATDPTHPAYEYFRDRYATQRAQGAAAIRQFQAAGTIPAHLDAEKLSMLMFSAAEGLQVQWLYDGAIDMQSRFLELWRLMSPASGSQS